MFFFPKGFHMSIKSNLDIQMLHFSTGHCVWILLAKYCSSPAVITRGGGIFINQQTPLSKSRGVFKIPP